jgi:glycosyltransferase involved in cell wall biosynthesis
MNILFILPEYASEGGGIGSFYSALLPTLAKQGVSVTAVVGSAFSDGPKSFSSSNLSIVPLDNAKALTLRSRFAALGLTPDQVGHLASAWSAWEQTEGGHGFDVVECTDWGLFFVPWLLVPSGPPLVVRLHGSEGQIAHYDPESCSLQGAYLSQLIESALLPRASLLSTYGRTNQKAWSDQLGREVRYCPPPLAIRSSDRSHSVQCDRGLVVGRVQRWKGPETLCRAVQLLGDQAPQIDWVGRSVTNQSTGLPYSLELAQIYPDIWGSTIFHHPSEPKKSIEHRQSSYSFILVPSEWDVFNFTAIESMSQKAIVICSSAAGASDLIQHGVNGFVFQSGDAHGLASLIKRVQSISLTERQSIGDAAYATVSDLLSPTVIAPLVIQEFREALYEPRRTALSQDLLNKALSPSVSSLSPETILNCNLERLSLKVLLRHIQVRLQRKALSFVGR